jgi:hypothetical protein
LKRLTCSRELGSSGLEGNGDRMIFRQVARRALREIQSVPFSAWRRPSHAVRRWGSWFRTKSTKGTKGLRRRSRMSCFGMASEGDARAAARALGVLRGLCANPRLLPTPPLRRITSFVPHRPAEVPPSARPPAEGRAKMRDRELRELRRAKGFAFRRRSARLRAPGSSALPRADPCA